MTWEMPKSGNENITVEEFDKEVEKLNLLTIQKKQASKALDDISSQVENQKQVLFKLLKKSGKMKYTLDGVGSVAIITEESFQTPKTNEEKEAFFNWVEKKHGKDFLMAKLQFHSRSLNTFLKTERDAELLNGNTIFNPPGIPQLTPYEVIKFNQKK